MCDFSTPILKLQGIADTLYAAGHSDIEIESLAGIGEILNDIADEFKELEEEVGNKLDAARAEVKAA